jgi:uncharacterized protein with HEPN domain
VYLEHILDSAERIRRFISAGRDAFFADDMAQDAVVRNLEIIEEATNWSLVWLTATDDVPKLAARVTQILEADEP